MACTINDVIYVTSAEARIILGISASAMTHNITKLIFRNVINLNDFDFATNLLESAGVLSEEMKIRIKQITDKTRATYLIPIDQVVEKAKAYKEKENKRIERKLKRIQEALKLVNESNGYTNNQILEKE